MQAPKLTIFCVSKQVNLIELAGLHEGMCMRSLVFTRGVAVKLLSRQMWSISGWLRVCIEVRYLVDMKKKCTVMQ